GAPSRNILRAHSIWTLFLRARPVRGRNRFHDGHWSEGRARGVIFATVRSRAKAWVSIVASRGGERRIRAAKIAVIPRGMMNTNLIALATELPDHDLLARIAVL